MRQKQGVFSLFLLSPSSRRAWIEMVRQVVSRVILRVALLAEGVDRNTESPLFTRSFQSSPSSRRAWIEIHYPTLWESVFCGSPSSRRAWIEMLPVPWLFLALLWSPSSRRAWIEMVAA